MVRPLGYQPRRRRPGGFESRHVSMEEGELNTSRHPDLKKILLRVGIGDHHLGFWCARTADGFSIGPLISGEEHVHSTFYINGEVINAHLTIREHGERYYRNLVTMTVSDLQSKVRQAVMDMMNSLRYANPKQDALLFAGPVAKPFRKLFSGSLEMTYKGRTGYLDFDFGLMLDGVQEVIQNPSELFTFGKAGDLIGSDYQFGVTGKGIPIFPIDDKLVGWNPVHRSNFYDAVQQDGSSGSLDSIRSHFGEPLYDVVSVTGIPQLFSEIERRQIFRRWFEKHQSHLMPLLRNLNI